MADYKVVSDKGVMVGGNLALETIKKIHEGNIDRVDEATKTVHLKKGSKYGNSFANGVTKADRVINSKLQAAGIENGSYPEKNFTAPGNIKSHPQFTQTDYSYFRGKGYSNQEIKMMWDRENKEGNKPLNWQRLKSDWKIGNASESEKRSYDKGYRDAVSGSSIQSKDPEYLRGYDKGKRDNEQ
jgi:hypothetical protein